MEKPRNFSFAEQFTGNGQVEFNAERFKTVRIITDDNLAAEAAVPWNFSFRPPRSE